MSPNPQTHDQAYANAAHGPKRRGASATPIIAFGALLPLAPVAEAHDVWSNGQPVPSWVKKACCGPEDVHHLSPDQVHLTSAGWRVDGYPDLIPIGKELPSPDGGYWIFYRTLDNGDKSIVYCFFTPFSGT